MRRSVLRHAALLVGLGLGLALGAMPAAGESPVRVSGRIGLGVPGASLAAAGPVVVYLEPEEPVPPPPPPAKRAELQQRNARFSPPFLAIVRGQTVDMPNFDRIYHNVFSYSRPNDFDLGTYPAGTSRSVTFEHSGIVKAYCSIHERMSATIFVAPNPWFAVAAPSGEFAIEDVPAGRYVLRTWAERLPATEQPLSVRAGRPTTVEITVAGSGR